MTNSNDVPTVPDKKLVDFFSPLVPSWMVALSGAFVPVLVVLGRLLPAPYAGAAEILAFVSAALAGLALPMPRFGARNPFVPLAAVPFLSAVVPILVQASAQLAPPWSMAAYGAAVLVAFAAGLAAPQPMTIKR